MQHQPNHPHQNKTNYLLLRIIWQNALNTVTNILAQVSVAAEDGSQ
jgi:hypothetical protein